MKQNVVRICAFLVMVCFFLPFFTVSCEGESRNVTGIDLATGVEGYSEPEQWVFGVLLFAAVILFANLFRQAKPFRDMIELAGSAAGLLMMYLIYDKVCDKLGVMGAVTDISEVLSTRYGFWGCVIGYLVILGTSLLSRFGKSE